MRALFVVALMLVASVGVADEATCPHAECPFCKAQAKETDCRVATETPDGCQAQTCEADVCDSKTCGDGSCTGDSKTVVANPAGNCCKHNNVVATNNCGDCKCAKVATAVVAAPASCKCDPCDCDPCKCGDTAVAFHAANACQCDPCQCEECDCAKPKRTLTLGVGLKLSSGELVLAAPRVKVEAGQTATIEITSRDFAKQLYKALDNTLSCEISVNYGDPQTTPTAKSTQLTRAEEEWLLLGKHPHSVARGPVTVDDVIRR